MFARNFCHGTISQTSVLDWRIVRQHFWEAKKSFFLVQRPSRFSLQPTVQALHKTYSPNISTLQKIRLYLHFRSIGLLYFYSRAIITYVHVRFQNKNKKNASKTASKVNLFCVCAGKQTHINIFSLSHPTYNSTIQYMCRIMRILIQIIDVS